MKIACFYKFLHKNHFLPIFYTKWPFLIFFFFFFWGHAHIVMLKWGHALIIGTYFGINGKRMSINTGSKYRVIWPSVLIIWGLQQPPFRKYVWEKPSGEQGLIIKLEGALDCTSVSFGLFHCNESNVVAVVIVVVFLILFFFKFVSRTTTYKLSSCVKGVVQRSLRFFSL